MKKLILLMVIALSLCSWSLVYGQTPDGLTPAEEQSCTKYEGQGARHGLCIAYCEAQDCRNYKDDPACLRIRDNFISYSKKKGYPIGKKGYGKTVIDCSETACTADDIYFCKGKEVDCFVDGECTETCSRTSVVLNDGKRICSINVCKPCLKDPGCDYKDCPEPIEVIIK